MFERRYLNGVILINAKDSAMVSSMEGIEDDCPGDGKYPKARIIQEPRRYIMAIIKSLQYSRMGIFNCILPDNKPFVVKE